MQFLEKNKATWTNTVAVCLSLSSPHNTSCCHSAGNFQRVVLTKVIKPCFKFGSKWWHLIFPCWISELTKSQISLSYLAYGVGLCIRAMRPTEVHGLGGCREHGSPLGSNSVCLFIPVLHGRTKRVKVKKPTYTHGGGEGRWDRGRVGEQSYLLSTDPVTSNQSYLKFLNGKLQKQGQPKA